MFVAVLNQDILDLASVKECLKSFEMIGDEDDASVNWVARFASIIPLRSVTDVKRYVIHISKNH
jgi:hypothetical protein